MAAPAATAPLQLDPKYDDYDFPTVAPVPAPGHPGHLTAEQQAQVSQLRLMLESQGYTDRLDTLTLVRRARLANHGSIGDGGWQFVTGRSWLTWDCLAG